MRYLYWSDGFDWVFWDELVAEILTAFWICLFHDKNWDFFVVATGCSKLFLVRILFFSDFPIETDTWAHVHLFEGDNALILFETADHFGGFLLVEGYKELFVEVAVSEELFEKDKHFFKEYLLILFVEIHLLAMQLGE